MSNNFVAIILPIYKGDKPEYIIKSIDSIISQSYQSIKLIIGVDGPIGDDLLLVLKKYEELEAVNVFWFQENRGLAIVLNDLLEECFNKGYEYIARMDADDISTVDRIEKQMAYLLSHPEVDVVGGAITEIDSAGNSNGKTIIYPETHDECFHFFSKRNPHAHPAVLFRRRFFDKAGCKYRPEYRQNQDTMLWLDGMRAGTKHANIQDVILNFRFTDSLFKKRRNGWAFAKKQLHDRKIINETLGYGFGATVFGYMMFIMLISPAWIKKIAYKIFR